MRAGQMGTNDNAYSLALISLKVHNIQPQQLALYRLYDELVNIYKNPSSDRCESKAAFQTICCFHMYSTDWQMKFWLKMLCVTWMMLLINFQVCNQPKHLFSTGFVFRSSRCVIHADWLLWNHDNRSQRPSFYTQCLIFVFLFFSTMSTMGLCICLPACVFVQWLYGVVGREGD